MFGIVALVAVAAMVLASCASTGQDASPATDAPASTVAAVTVAAGQAPQDGATPPPARSSGANDAVGSTTVEELAPDDVTTIPSPAGCAGREAGAAGFVTEAGGPAVRVRVYVPAGAGEEPLPVVLNWHGLGSNGGQQALLSGYEDLADAEGFIAVHPTGASAVGAAGNSWELAQFDVPGRDDLAMVDDLIDRLVTEYCADSSRVYSTGLSNGGFFTALLVCERADRIAAAVSVAGVSHPEGCRPSRPVPFVAFHGTADEVVPFDGGRSSLEGATPPAARGDFFDQSMPQEFAEFAADFGCLDQPDSVAVGDEVTRHDYVGCDGQVPLSFYEITDGGHTWPGSPLGPLLTAVLGRTTDEVDATSDGWDFLHQFSLAESGD